MRGKLRKGCNNIYGFFVPRNKVIKEQIIYTDTKTIVFESRFCTSLYLWRHYLSSSLVKIMKLEWDGNFLSGFFFSAFSVSHRINNCFKGLALLKANALTLVSFFITCRLGPFVGLHSIQSFLKKLRRDVLPLKI